ncbi:hypothetical protein T08_10034, partial [Trichinella sp. T8]
LLLGILSEFEGHADLNHPFYVHAQLFLKPVVHRVTTINGNEQSLQRSNLYRRKPAEAVSRILRKNYSKTYMVGEAAPENIRRADADQPWTILTAGEYASALGLSSWSLQSLLSFRSLLRLLEDIENTEEK